MELTERRDLRGGRSCWSADDYRWLEPDAIPSDSVDIAIVGAGVMGAMLADRLAGMGRHVVLLDRRQPSHGSTAASTALVMWGADVPLLHLARVVGEDEATRRWRRVFQAVRNLATLIDRSGIDCGKMDRPELYLAGTLLNEAALAAEADMRRAAGLPSEFLEAAAVSDRFDIAPRAALLSSGSYDVDPVKLTLGLLTRARRNGASICFPVDIARIEQKGDATLLHGIDGVVVEAHHVILAPGYERATRFLPDAFSVGSSYAIATPLGTAPLWRENAMIWEASSPYLYARATADGRILAGGEDEAFSDAKRRDALINAKGRTIAAKLTTMIAVDDIQTDYVWSAAFGSSPDGLPAIGRARNHEKLWLASGFGGNGVTFAALAAELIAAELRRAPDKDAPCFDPYRFD